MLCVWYMAAVRQIGLSKETYFDHSTPLGSPFYLHIHEMLDRKQNSKRAVWQRNSTSGSNSDNCHLLVTFLCVSSYRI